MEPTNSIFSIFLGVMHLKYKIDHIRVETRFVYYIAGSLMVLISSFNRVSPSVLVI